MKHAPPGKIKSGRASLIGGFVVGIATFVLWVAIARELQTDPLPSLISGLVVATGIGAWIRIADL